MADAPDEAEEGPGSISEQLGEFLGNSGFDSKLYEFLQNEVSSLTIAPDGEEQALEVFDVYRKFTQLFDGEFTEFMESLGISSMEEMSQHLAAEDSSDERASQFLAKLLASMEYEAFVSLARDFNDADEEEDDEEDSDDEEAEGAPENEEEETQNG